eukprot:CAMPEP_0172551874 /NCGR_PEP_ID=MMETSP1067-20121228/41814_1 /TAXON_ID=265564 ORGANISM="Thalassiosira punctigera, Strain Tpunct2005C2" /NCGR_SAMPLE_ID=MMETSP1067 /ASSEMBLY_ACC=CAM_ASM_000444 /LENGTH=399 /DNA_ID=CAMNT_0013339723 /DNA_START=80 /DNA_END=1279 /DNA_ORIENTATION=+
MNVPHDHDVVGMPSQRRREWTLDTDPRTWPAFSRVTLRDGALTSDTLVARGGSGSDRHRKEFRRPPSEYLGAIPSEKYPAEAGRYHLFVAGLCPWASSTATARRLLGLEDVISMDVADGQSGAGWAFLDGASVGPWRDRDRPGGGRPFWLHEAYQLDDPRATTRITVPVLWDTQTNSVVSNDSWTILKMLSTAFAGMGEPSPEAAAMMSRDSNGNLTLTPAGRESEIENVHAEIYDALLNGVYKAGLGYFLNGNEENEAVRAAREGVYHKLEELDERLSRRRFLLGDELSAPDVRLAMNLFRWDVSYHDAFVLNGGRGGILVGGDGDDGDGYPHLRAYLRDLYVVMEPCVDFVAMRQYYRMPQAMEKAAGVEREEGEPVPLPDLRPIVASARQCAGPRP